ncbi:induced myeloid leukemia cell differentiation protein Mcl-1 [Alligator mississippiensis]|nr:induced myeloid leukemia cell differentiation protein Mcl-1 [Alligator mississippiensis]
MLNLKRNAVLGLNLYCGGGPSMAPASPSSPGVGGGGSAGSSAAPSPAEEPAVLLGGGAPNGCSEAPRSLIGCPPAPRALIGGAARWRPEEELDGCEPEAEDELRRASLALISRYLREAAGAVDSGPGGKNLFKGLLGAGGRAAEPGLERALDTLRRVGDGVLQKHQLAFQGMLRKLEIRNEEDLQSVSAVATHMFSDGITNWGRVVTLISFGAFVVKHLKSINQENCINTLAGIITDLLVTDKRDWLVSQRGWEGFVEFFHVEDLEGSIRNVLMAFAGVAGLGASLAYMIR